MQYRELGRTGEKVSALGFGCMRLPVTDGQEDRIDGDLASDLLDEAISEGVNYLDTAYPYHKGMSERFLGDYLRGGKRNQVYLATKLPCWEVSEPGDMDALLQEQLKRLQTDFFDFYLLHNIKREWWQRLYEFGVLDFLDQAIRQGRIRYAGFSFHDEPDHFRRVVDSYDWDFCQIQYNYMDEEAQAGTAGLEYAASKGLGVVVMEPLRGGTLANRMPEDIQGIWEEMKTGRSPAEWGLRWVWNRPEVSVALSGMNSREQVRENCRIAHEAEAHALTGQELELITRVREAFSHRLRVPCTGCGYCTPCPSGVNIPRIFGLYNDRFMFGDKRYPHLMYTMSTNRAEQADNCQECGECEEVCPQGIEVVRELKKAHEVLVEPPDQ